MAAVSLFANLEPVEFEGLALWHVTNLSMQLLKRPITTGRSILPLVGLTLLENAELIDGAASFLEDEFTTLVDTMDAREVSRFEFECVFTQRRFVISATARARRIFIHAIDDCNDEFEQLQLPFDF